MKSSLELSETMIVNAGLMINYGRIRSYVFEYSLNFLIVIIFQPTVSCDVTISFLQITVVIVKEEHLL